ncbi:glycoside hydrolase family 2 protein [Halostella litorea]|uniref:glycoside hydrolase family 2 n=1 Tax=Halostella litorea TaxID=2528831 RepID=UPI001092F29D|nr:glycoside hydrolase family 2 [Halostella litorea]
MTGTWTAAAVDPGDDGDPPSAGEWEDVSVPGQPERFAGESAVAYRLAFDDPRSDDAQRTLLDLRGLYAHARVWLNGDLLGEHDAYFVPFRREFVPEERNELVVECRAPEDAFGGVERTDQLPTVAGVPGIRWGAHVRVRPPTFLDDLTVEPRVDGDDATIEATVAVDAGEAVDDYVTFSLRPEGFRGGGAMERAEVTADAGERTTVSREIRVRDPSFWWPNDHGPQHRYTVRAKLGDASASATTGLRTVSYGDDGLRVNGRQVQARGVNVLPAADPAADVERAADANANLVRAHAHVPPHDLHEAADEAGLLVWQDLPLSGDREFDPDRGRALAAMLADEYGHHPSVSLYGVHDDPRSPFADPLGAGRTSRYRLRWRAWRTSYDRGPAERVAEAFPDGTPTVPVAGPPGTAPDAAHLYPGWSYGAATDAEWLLDRYPDLGGVVGEYGAGSLVADAEGDVPGFDRATHDAAVGTDDPAESQARQAATLKTVTETLRRRSTDVLAAFALRDAAPGAGMGVLAHGGEAKPGYEALGESFEPVQAMLDEPPSPGAVGVTVVNDGPEAVEPTLSWAAGDAEGTAELSVDPGDRVDAGAARIPPDADDVELLLTLSDRTVYNEYDL